MRRTSHLLIVFNQQPQLNLNLAISDNNDNDQNFGPDQIWTTDDIFLVF